jgi:hypothetical protein
MNQDGNSLFKRILAGGLTMMAMAGGFQYCSQPADTSSPGPDVYAEEEQVQQSTAGEHETDRFMDSMQEYLNGTAAADMTENTSGCSYDDGESMTASMAYTSHRSFLESEYSFDGIDDPALEDEVIDNTVLLLDDPYREAFTATLSKLSRYRDYIAEAACMEGAIADGNDDEPSFVDEGLLYANLAVESQGDLKALSAKGAGGLSQFMPATAEAMGLTVNNAIDERFSPEAIPASAAYLRHLEDRFDDKMLVLAAYNWGERNVDDLVTAYGDDWDDIENKLPRETRHHIERVLSREVAWEKRHELGLTYDDEPLYSDRLRTARQHRVSDGETLEQIAAAYGVPVDDIADLNPALKDPDLLPVGAALHVPGTGGPGHETASTAAAR